MRFDDRLDAGRRLGRELRNLELGDPVVLGIPRGGVIVARAAAAELGAPLDVVVTRKIRAPGNPELGLGAVASGVEVLDENFISSLGVSREYLDGEVALERAEVDRRTAAYRGGRPPVAVTGKTAVIVDDGIATGGTASAAIRWAKAIGAARVILAVPVASPSVRRRLENEADSYVVLSEPEAFYAVGQWYDSFDQLSDDAVIAAMSEAVGDAP